MEKIHEIFNERNILSKIKHPNIINLYSSFSDQKNVYMLFDYALNGDLAQLLKINSISTTLIINRNPEL